MYNGLLPIKPVKDTDVMQIVNSYVRERYRSRYEKHCAGTTQTVAVNHSDDDFDSECKSDFSE